MSASGTELPIPNVRSSVANGGKADKICSMRVLRIFDPNVWSGRALQENFHRVGGCAVLHQCIRPLELLVLLATMDISARASSLADRPQWGHSGHQCSHAPGRPILHLVSHPLADLGR